MWSFCTCTPTCTTHAGKWSLIIKQKYTVFEHFCFWSVTSGFTKYNSVTRYTITTINKWEYIWDYWNTHWENKCSWPSPPKTQSHCRIKKLFQKTVSEVIHVCTGKFNLQRKFPKSLRYYPRSYTVTKYNHHNLLLRSLISNFKNAQ